MYHYVRDTKKTAFPEIKALSITDFEHQLHWFQERFTVLSYSQFETALSERKVFDIPTALLTFDDGFSDHAETVAPLLASRGLSGVFFLVEATLDPKPLLLNVHKTHFLLARLGADSFDAAVRSELSSLDALPSDVSKRENLYRYDAGKDGDIKRLLNYELPFQVADAVLDTIFRRHLGDPVDFARSLYLSSDQIRSMAAQGMTFGGHTKTHRVLSRLDANDQRSELSTGAETIRKLTGQSSVPFCYPYGHSQTYTEETIEILKESGYSSAFATTRSGVDFLTADAYRIPRYDTKDLPPFVQAFTPYA